MGAFLSLISSWIIGSNLARIFTGVGVAVVSQVFLTGFVNDALGAMTSAFGALGSDVGNIFKMLGFGTYLSVIGTAFLTRVAVLQLQRAWSLTTPST
jgi:hypothetical protein